MCLNFSRYGHRGLGPGSVKSSLDWIMELVKMMMKVTAPTIDGILNEFIFLYHFLGHTLKLVKPRCHLDIRKFSFAHRVNDTWNSLMDERLESIIA